MQFLSQESSVIGLFFALRLLYLPIGYQSINQSIDFQEMVKKIPVVPEEIANTLAQKFTARFYEIG